MEHRVLGGSGIRVSPLCLGAMMFGRGANPDHDECIRMVHRACDAGVNFIDTADAYSAGESEEIIAKAVSDRRDRIVIATKVFFPMSGEANERGGSRRWIVRAVEDSLRRLGTDYIDLYQLHRIDPDTALEESLAALDDLVRAGKVRAIGTSTARAEQIVECHWTSERRGLARIRCEQAPYSILTRGVESDVLPTCRRYGMGVIAWGPLNGGWLADKYRRGARPPEGSRAAKSFFNPGWWDFEREAVARKFDILDGLRALAEEAGVSLVELSLAWCIEHPAITAAIIGPRTPEQLELNLKAHGLRLSSEQLDAIDALVPPGTNVDASNTVELNPELASRSARRRARN